MNISDDIKVIGVILSVCVLIASALFLAIGNEPRKDRVTYPDAICHCPCDSPDRIGNAP